jgi:HAE1 family hydrophobic/amphiphilic exporter-1
VGIAIYQLPGSNALDVGANVIAELETLSQNFPPGLTFSVVYDTTEFIQVSIQEVLITLLQAIGLVILVIFIFLQDWRTTIIPGHCHSGGADWCAGLCLFVWLLAQ